MKVIWLLLLSLGSPVAFAMELHKAARKDDASAIFRLVSQGMNIDALDVHKRTPLIVAILSDAANAVGALLTSNASVHCCYRKKVQGRWVTMSPLAVAVARKSKLIVSQLLFYDADISATLEVVGFTPLHIVVHSSGPISIVSMLVTAGCDVNAQTASGETPLLLALKMKNFAAVPVLLVAGADPRIQGSTGCALDWLGDETPPAIRSSIFSHTIVLPFVRDKQHNLIRKLITAVGYKLQLRNSYQIVFTLLLVGRRLALPKLCIYQLLQSSLEMDNPFWHIIIHRLIDEIEVPVWCWKNLGVLLHKYRVSQLKAVSSSVEELDNQGNLACLQRLLRKKLRPSK